MRRPQRRQRARSSIQLSTGTLSNQRMGAPHPGQADPGRISERRCGSRYTQTLAKLPTTRPSSSAVQGQAHGSNDTSSASLPGIARDRCHRAARVSWRMASTVREDEAPADAAPLLADAPHRVTAPRPALLIAVAALVAAAFLAAMLAATQGRFVPQVLDLYLVAQYAQSMAQGHPFQYSPGDAPTTGATSLLHTALLALAHRLGARGEGLIAFAVLSGAVFYTLTVLLAARIGARLAGPREGLAAGLLVALCGPVAWGFLYGADIALAMLLATWLLDQMLASWPRGGLGWVLPASLLALARPEGLVAALVLACAYTLGP